MIITDIKNEIKKVIIGKDTVIEDVLTAIFAGGHIMLEDIPGVGKTTLALALSKCMSLKYNRMQFTPDVLPGDVTGFTMYNKKTDSFDYKEGAVMCNLFLADELNRTSPKTQSALLETMEEGRVTVDGVTHFLPTPFFVIATQNPLGSAGTQKLPESQLDRFMVRLSMGYPDFESEKLMLRDENKNRQEEIRQIISLEEIINIQNEIASLHVEEDIYSFIASLTEKSRNSELLRCGVSPRGAKALLRFARAKAYLNSRDYVVPEDVSSSFLTVCSHRVTLSAKAKSEGMSEETALTKIKEEVK